MNIVDVNNEDPVSHKNDDMTVFESGRILYSQDGVQRYVLKVFVELSQFVLHVVAGE